MIELYTAIFLFGIGAYLNKNMKDPIEIKTTAPANNVTENVYNTKIKILNVTRINNHIKYEPLLNVSNIAL